MNKEQLLKRKAELAALLADETRSIEDLDAVEKELRDINENLAAIEKREQLMIEARGIENGTAPSTVVTTFNEQSEQRSEDENQMEYRKAFMNYVLNGEKIPSELRNATTKTSDVGTAIPKVVLNKIVEKLEATGMILPLVNRTSFKGGLAIPTGTLKPVATWVAEGAGSTKQKKTTSEITFAYHKLRCAVAVTLETEVTTLEIFEQTIINNIVEAMVKALEQAIVNGDGTGKPKGIIAETPHEGQVITVAAVTYPKLVEAESALPVEYEDGAVWTMTKKTFGSFLSMVDDQGQPIARVNYGIGGKPERILLGRPVVLVPYLPNFANAEANAVFAYLFNYADYTVNTNYNMGIKKYIDEETDDTVTKSVMLVDGKVVDKGSLVTLKKAVSAG